MRSADYVQETTTSIAGASGNGAVTLTAVTNKPRFSTVFGTTARWVRYIIEDTVNSIFEQGIGSVASNVLTRTKPQITWDGTTWKDGNAVVSALAFGSSPTSGNIIIRMASTAESQGVIIDARQSSVTGDANWRDYGISSHIPWGSAGGGTTLTANREYYAAYKLETPGLLQGVQLEITTAIAASNIALALYDMGNTGLPSSKIADFVGFTTAATGIKTDTAVASWTPAGAIWLTPGWYVIGFIASHAIAIRQSNARALCCTPYGRADAYGWSDLVYVGGAGTTLPATPSPTTMQGSAAAGSQPWIGLKVTP